MFYQETGLRNGSGLEAHAAIVPTRGLEGRSRGGQNGELERSIAITEALDTGSPVASLPLDFSVREPQIPFFKAYLFGFFWHLQLNEPYVIYLLAISHPSITTSYQIELLLQEKEFFRFVFPLPSNRATPGNSLPMALVSLPNQAPRGHTGSKSI